MKRRHTNPICSKDHREPEVSRITCMDCGLSVRLLPEATPPPGTKLQWGVQEWGGQGTQDGDRLGDSGQGTGRFRRGG